MPKKIWSIAEDNILKGNYEKLGSILALKLLSTKSPEQIQARAKAFGLKKTKNVGLKVVTCKEYYLPDSKFIEVHSPEISYILGLLWADGYIAINARSYLAKTTNKSEDIDLLLPLLTPFLEGWSVRSSYANHPTYKPQTQLGRASKRLYNHLNQMGYTNRLGGVCRVLDYMDPTLHKYWFRGFIDGDGCFYYNKKNKCKQFCVAGPFDQEWGFFTKLLDSLKIRYSVIRSTSKKGHKSSKVRVCGKANITLLGNYLYDDYESHRLGFERKYNTYKAIENSL